jgi:hypothetical protein
MGLGQGTNNYVEILVLKLLLIYAIEKEIYHIQIFGDSMNVINWARKHQICHTIFLIPILDDIFRLLDAIDSLVISHVYMDMNMVEDTLFKASFQLTLAQWHFTEHKGEDSYAFYHQLFIEYHGHSET